MDWKSMALNVFHKLGYDIYRIETHKKLQQAGNHIKQRLEKFIDRERLPGHCELCRWPLPIAQLG